MFRMDEFFSKRIDAILKFIKKVDFIKKKIYFFLMHTRFGPELGLKSVSYYKPLNQMEPPVPKKLIFQEGFRKTANLTSNKWQLVPFCQAKQRKPIKLKEM
jgi:hypothetical protein